jgi:hypothetical protein
MASLHLAVFKDQDTDQGDKAADVTGKSKKKVYDKGQTLGEKSKSGSYCYSSTLSGVVPAGSTYASASKTTAPRRVAKPMPFLYMCKNCHKHYKIRKRMETHQLACAGSPTNDRSRRNAGNATTSITPNLPSIHIVVATDPSASTPSRQ